MFQSTVADYRDELCRRAFRPLHSQPAHSQLAPSGKPQFLGRHRRLTELVGRSRQASKERVGLRRFGSGQPFAAKIVELRLQCVTFSVTSRRKTIRETAAG